MLCCCSDDRNSQVETIKQEPADGSGAQPPEPAAPETVPQEEAVKEEAAPETVPQEEAVKEEAAPEPEPQAEPEESPKEAPKPCPGDFTFSSVEGKEQVLTFTKKPLGITFKTEMPLVVKSVTAGTEAEGFGVCAQWQLKKIGDQSLAGMKYENAIAKVKEVIGALPAA